MVSTLIVLLLLRAGWKASAPGAYGPRGPLLVAGMLAGLAVWTKNEGILLVIATAPLVAWITLRGGQLRQVAW